MKEKLLHFGSYVLVAMLSTILTLALTTTETDRNTGKLAELEALIEEKFIGEAEGTLLEDAAADAMVKATGDRWSYYIPASEYQQYQEQMANAYVGVGITIQQAEEQMGFLIIDVTPGGPAEEAGLLVKDLLVEVEGRDVREMKTTEVRDLIRGKESSLIALTVQRGEERLNFSVERRTVETPVATYTLLEDNVGLVTIENFDSRCAEESIAAIKALLEQGAEKLIFDVRHNPGGYADELVELLDYLLPEGEVFHTIRYDGKENVNMSDADYLDIPMAVLVNAGSYSAAEFFAAALRDYEAGIVVGEQTVGKGYYQSTYRLSDGSAVSLSIGEYFTPTGQNLAEVGITPDIVVPVEEQTALDIYYGTLDPSEDPQIQAAIKALK
ncbi:MAG: PDZ domain-containing protein [Oscillospiraceae bacterium]|nr:PDZ domain-containing protein [Oscillospiraceae bacterium]